MTAPVMIRRLAGGIAALLLAGLPLLVVGAAPVLGAEPAFGYNAENAMHVRIWRDGPVVCDAPIAIVADVTDRRGAPVPETPVTFELLLGEPGDTVVAPSALSDSHGQARTTLELACIAGTRQLRASLPDDGRASILLTCAGDQGCRDTSVGAVGGASIGRADAPVSFAEAAPGQPAATPWSQVGAMVIVLGLLAGITAGMLRRARQTHDRFGALRLG